MGDHDTWFDYLPGFGNLKEFAEHYLKRDWQWQMFQDTHFTLGHVFSLLATLGFMLFAVSRWRAHTNAALASGDLKDLVPPKVFGLHNLVEMLTEAVFNTMVGVMGEKNAKKYLTLIGSLAFFIFFSNVLALIPGFLPPTDTLKTNLGLALVVFLMTHVYGVKENGLGYFKHFLGPYLPIAPLMVLVEIVSHIARPVSLALRLMGNMAADHKVVLVFFGLVPLLVPVPFLLLGTIVVIVQTLVFCLLSMVYISMAVAHEEHH